MSSPKRDEQALRKWLRLGGLTVFASLGFVAIVLIFAFDWGESRREVGLASESTSAGALADSVESAPTVLFGPKVEEGGGTDEVAEAAGARKVSQNESENTRGTAANADTRELVGRWLAASRRERRSLLDRLLARKGSFFVVLRDLLRTGTAEEKMRACSILAQARDEEAVDALLNTLDDPNPHVQVRGILSLARMGVRAAAGPIRERLVSTSDILVEIACVTALGALGDASDHVLLQDLLAHEDARLQVCAAYALARLGNTGGDEVLLAATHNAEGQARRDATYSLGFLDTPEARARLEEIIATPEGRWKTEAHVALANQRLRTCATESDSLNVLADCARDDRTSVAAWAFELLEGWETSAADTVLEQLAEEPNWNAARAGQILQMRSGK
jgi:hypothetical protein